MKSRKHGVEVWFQFLPEAESYPLIPHVEAMRKVFHLATNDSEELFTALPISQKQLDTLFNASWGLVNVFKPKLVFQIKPIVSYYRYTKKMLE